MTAAKEADVPAWVLQVEDLRRQAHAWRQAERALRGWIDDLPASGGDRGTAAGPLDAQGTPPRALPLERPAPAENESR